MATSNKTKDTTVRISMSKAIGNGQYQKVYDPAEATGINVHRNDASAKAFKAEVDALAKKLEGKFELHSQEAKRALFVRQRPMSVQDLISSIDEGAPF